MLATDVYVSKSKRSMNRLVFSLGFAMFAMFFGAGNLVFPLAVGAHAGLNIIPGIFGFILSGVLVPFLGLYAISLYHGNYSEFLSCLGKIPAFIVTFVLITVIGIIIATPRTSTLAYGTFAPLVTHSAVMSVMFKALYFAGVYFISIHQTKVLTWMGYILSPLKISVLLLLIVTGIFIAPSHSVNNAVLSTNIFLEGLKSGYSTMDLLAAFFFCAFVYQYIHFQTKHLGDDGRDLRQSLTLKACLIGGILLAIVYIGFMMVANKHSMFLQTTPTASMIGVLSNVLFNHYGDCFVAICVTLACLSTAIAVTAITVDFFQTKVFQNRLPYKTVLLLVTMIVFIMSNLGFDGLMKLAVPILEILYPALLALTIGNILAKIFQFRYSAWLFYGVLIFSLCTNFLG